MKKLFLILLSLFFLVSCSTVSYLPSNTSITYPSTDRCEVLWNKPQAAYSEIGLIIVECSVTVGGSCGDGNMLIKLKEKALLVGADAIIVNFGPEKEHWWVAGDFFTGIVSAGSYSTHKLEGMAIRFKEKRTE